MIKKIVLLILTAAAAMQITAGAVDLSARGAALIEQTSGRMLYGKNENARMPMASTTKIMTGLLAAESGKLDKEITVPAEALRVEGSSMGLRANEKLTLRNITYGLLLESGNDAANTIAYTLGGSIPEFTVLMNHKAEMLGLKNTHFVTPSGLDADGHYTSALDLAKLGASAMNNRDFAEIVGTKKIKIPYEGIKDARCLYNHNRLLSIYNGAVGIKTGFTKKSGRCLVSCAKRDGVCLVVCTLNGYDDWDDHKKLLDYGFSLIKSYKIPNDLGKIKANVVGGASDAAAVTCEPECFAALKENEIDKVTSQINMERFYYAPVKKGQKLGEIVYKLGDYTVAKSDISAAEDVEFKQTAAKSNFFTDLWQNIKSFFINIFK